ncbi:hypothetical protein JW960_26010 [candidate division KSB1 bacterium]|nr:hypothetical protein [candidate division KSB1 bacterium]
MPEPVPAKRGNICTGYLGDVDFDTVRAANNGGTPVRDGRLSRRLLAG